MFKLVIHFIRFCFARFTASNKVVFFSVAVTALVAIVSAVVMPMIQRNVIAGVEAGALNNALLALMFGISFVGIVCAVYEALALNKLNATLKNGLQRELFGKAVRYSSKVITTRGSGAFMTSILGDSGQLGELLNTNYFSAFLVVVSSLAIVAITLTWSPIFVMVVGPVYILSILIIVISNRVYIKQFAEAREGVMRVNPKLLERLENRLSLLGYANVQAVESALFAQFDTRDAHFRKAYAASAFSRSALDAVKTIGLVTLFLLSMTRIISGEINFATFVAMLSYYASIFIRGEGLIPRRSAAVISVLNPRPIPFKNNIPRCSAAGLLIPLSAVQNITRGMESFKLHHDKVKDDLERVPEIGLPKSVELRFDNCSFAYEGGQSRIENFSFNIDKPVGLVGLSGEGKTTTIKILFGEIQPQQGNCLLGGVKISEVSRAVLYSLLRVFNQDAELFADTLEYNITLGKLPLGEKEYADAVVAYGAALRDCAADLKRRHYGKASLEVARELFLLTDKQLKDRGLLDRIAVELEAAAPMFDTFAGVLASRKYYSAARYRAIIEALEIGYLADRDDFGLGQRGSKISGGEKNKVSLARFLLPLHKGFYIIDEPLTNVDAIAEEKSIRIISEFLNCPGIVISHKLNIIRALADEILVLEDGKISEKGTHDDLVKRGGLYAKLYEKFIELKN